MGTGAAAALAVPLPGGAQTTPDVVASSSVTFQVNGKRHRLALDTRTSLLDALREHLDLSGNCVNLRELVASRLGMVAADVEFAAGRSCRR